LHRAARAEKISFRQLHRAYAPPAEAPKPQRGRYQPPPEPDEDLPRSTPVRGPRLNEAAAFEMPSSGPGRKEPPPPVPVVSRVQQRLYNETADEPVERAEVVKGYEYEPDRFVVIEDDELRAITPETARNMQILEFVKLEEIDPVYFESSYYVSPEKAGEKAYALLYEALKRSGFVALAEFAMHRREHVVVVRAGKRGIILHTLFYNNEVRREDEYPANDSLVNPKELDVALLLVESMSGRFEPDKFRDTYREKLEALIAAKIQGREVARTPSAKPAPVVDIMDALQKSLQMARKPAAPEPAAPKRPAGKEASEKPRRKAQK
jgi:DNA end-binding protein Ku